MAKTIITVAPTGAWPTKKDNPNVPLTPKEIAEDVFESYQAGAAVAHIHVRDEEGRGTMDKEKFRETVELIREKCDIVLNLTTSGALTTDDEERVIHIKELRPEMASFDAGSMNWQHTTVFLNTPKFLEYCGTTFNEIGVKPELEIFDAGMVYNTLYYLKKGILKPVPHYQFVLGAAGGMAATVENLVFLKSLIPKESTFSAFGIGKGHLPILYTTLALGGHIRVGMEDNVLFSSGRLAKSNSEFVERTVRIIKEFGNEVATPEEAKQILGLRKQ